MSFDTALSGLNAASADLRVTGQNIANASTTGFKRSRAEFADVYASTLLGNGNNLIGSGVKLANVAQQFDQGTISFTNNSLDLAIDGNGFFILNQNGNRTYTRAGQFGVDKQGFVVTGSGGRVQGFGVSTNGLIGGALGDIKISSDNLQPRLTSLVNSTLNLDARSPVLSRIGSTLTTTGTNAGVARAGIAQATPSVIKTSAPPVPFDYSIDTASAITSGNPVTPFDFSVNKPSAISAGAGVIGFNFGLNSASSLTGSAAPINFNFADKPSALTGTANFTGFNFGGANSATFNVSIVGSGSDGVRTVTLNSNENNLAGLITNINAQLSGIGVTARVDPNNSNHLQLIATQPGQPSVITANNFVTNGATTAANLSGVLSGIADGAQSVRSSFDVTVAGGTNNGTATVLFTNNITSLPSLIADIRDQLSASGLAVDVREDPLHAGRLQFVSTDVGVASSIGVSNFRSSDAGVSSGDLANLLRLNLGATSAAPGAGAVGVTGSKTRSTFDVTIAGGTGAGGNATRTVALDRNIANGDVAGLAALINGQLAGVDVRAEEDPNNPGRLRFAATVAGEPSTVTVGNYTTSGVNGDVRATANDITNLFGGISSGSSDSSGDNTSAKFSVNLSGSSNASENQTRTITLNRNISTLQDLISDIRDDLVGSGIGMDVREDPTSPGHMQFFALRSGQAATITVNPTGVTTLGAGVTRGDVEATLGGISLGTFGVSGASNVIPDPLGSGGGHGVVGNKTSASFDLTLAGAAANNGTVSIKLKSNIGSLTDLINDIRDELSNSGVGVDVRADPANAGRLQFYATVSGEPAVIRISNLDTSNIGVTQTNLANTLNLATGVTELGLPRVANGYAAQSVDVVQPDGSVHKIKTPANATAAQIASQISSGAVPGISASATSTATIPAAGFTNTSGTLQLSLNGVRLAGNTLAELVGGINGTAGLGTVRAQLTPAGDLTVTDSVGNDLVFAVEQGGATDRVDVAGVQGQAITLSSTGTSAASIGGSLKVTLEEGVTLADPVPPNNLFGPLTGGALTPFVVNAFDPNNPETYNSPTSVSIFDSLGNSHTMSQYFVKERPDATGRNSWSMYVQIDGRNVGDPDANLPAPQNAEPTLAKFRVEFNPDGTLNPVGTPPILISNWVPRDATGVPNGALGPQNVLAGGTLPVPTPSTNSNFEIRLGGSTQFGSVFGVNAVEQNGFTTGRLSGVNVDKEGMINARFTNGQNKVLGQVALADFANSQGLTAVGNTSWAESNSSGVPKIGAPGSASLGAVSAGALEESNVDLSAQLVQLIIAQRNFQANAKTISTNDQITQSIIQI